MPNGAVSPISTGAAASRPSTPRLTGRLVAGIALDPISHAEEALARVEANNAAATAVRAAFAPPNEAITDDLAEAGFGPRTRVLTTDVMLRLHGLARSALLTDQA